MARPFRIKGPKETLVTDQPGRKIFFTGLIMALILGFFLRGLINPQFVQSELKSAVSRIHPSTQIGWSQAHISLKDGLWPRFAVIVTDVKIVSTEECWGQPLLYAREIELPFSVLSFFERGQPLRSLIVRDAFLELKSDFICDKNKKTAAKHDSASSLKLSGPVRLKSSAETSSRPPLVLQNFIFQNLKFRHNKWVFPDWQLQSLRLKIQENSPWYVEVDSDFYIPETQGIDTRAQLEIVYKEFPSQLLDANIQGHWREGNFRIKGQWAGPQVGWTFHSRFDHFPFQFLQTVALKTGAPWNWPDKPMWFSFKSQTLEPFKDWKESQHHVENLHVEGDLGVLRIPDLQIKSWQPFKVQPFAFEVQNADLSAGFSAAWSTPSWVQSWGALSGQGQWIQEDEFRFQGHLRNTDLVLTHRDRKLAQRIQQSGLQAELMRGQWKIHVDDFEWDSPSGTASLRIEGPQNLKSGRLTWLAEDLALPPTVLAFYEVLSLESKWDWRLNYAWRDSQDVELNSQLSTALFETRDINLEKPILTVRKRSSGGADFQLVTPNAALRAPFSFFPDELKTIEYPQRLGRTQFAWSSGDSGKWQLLSGKSFSRGDVNSQGELRGTFGLAGRSYIVEGTKESPLLRLSR